MATYSKNGKKVGRPTREEKARAEALKAAEELQVADNRKRMESAESVRAVLTEALRWYDRGKGNGKGITDDVLEETIEEFFNVCIKSGERPTFEKLALAVGVNRDTLYEWKVGNSGSERRHQIMQRAVETLAAFDAGMVSEGDMNVVLYIFRSKNFYGMKDQQNIEVSSGNPFGEVQTEQEIAERYELLPD